MIISYYGKGKGKTTAALGSALRASGYGKKILFVQFIKGDFPTGEDEALAKISNLTHKKFGLGFVGILGDERKLAEHQEAAQGGMRFVMENAENFDIVILDEVFGAIKGKLLDENSVIALLKAIKNQDLIMTGRPKISDLLNCSDLVTEMKQIKHPFETGTQAKKGIDF